MSDKVVNEIVKKIIDCDDKYVMDGRYIRWGIVEAELNAAIAAARSQALQEAEEELREYADIIGDEYRHDAAVVRVAAEIVHRLRLLPLTAQPAAAPACPVCGEPMQCGTTWLCVKDGQTVIV